MSPAARHRAGLRAATIDRLRAHFSAHPPAQAERIILFGSLARGDFDGASDTDLLVIGERLPDSAVEQASGRPVDMILWAPSAWARAMAQGHPMASAIVRDGLEIWRAG
jgi:UTP:GlnB (protein PII) uridylyltransferase